MSTSQLERGHGSDLEDDSDQNKNVGVFVKRIIYNDIAAVANDTNSESPPVSPIKTNLTARHRTSTENHVKRLSTGRSKQKREDILDIQPPPPPLVSVSPKTPLFKQRPSIHQKVVLIFEVVVSNEVKVKLRLRRGDDLMKIAKEFALHHRLDDLRLYHLQRALKEAMKNLDVAKTSEGTPTLSRGLGDWERHWDPKSLRWFESNSQTGCTRWIQQ